MQFLADQNIRFRAVLALRENGFDILHTSEIALAEAEDHAILNWAIQHNRTLIAFDQGFGDLRQTVLPSRHSGVIRLKLFPQKWEWVNQHLSEFLKSTNESELKNHLIILYNNRVRIR